MFNGLALLILFSIVDAFAKHTYRGIAIVSILGNLLLTFRNISPVRVVSRRGITSNAKYQLQLFVKAWINDSKSKDRTLS